MNDRTHARRHLARGTVGGAALMFLAGALLVSSGCGLGTTTTVLTDTVRLGEWTDIVELTFSQPESSFAFQGTAGFHVRKFSLAFGAAGEKEEKKEKKVSGRIV